MHGATCERKGKRQTATTAAVAFLAGWPSFLSVSRLPEGPPAGGGGPTAAASAACNSTLEVKAAGAGGIRRAHPPPAACSRGPEGRAWRTHRHPPSPPPLFLGGGWGAAHSRVWYPGLGLLGTATGWRCRAPPPIVQHAAGELELVGGRVHGRGAVRRGGAAGRIQAGRGGVRRR